MAFTRDTKFYKEFNPPKTTWNYRLVFVPGDVTALTNEDLTSDTLAEEFPNDIIINNLRVNGEFPDEVPYGLQKANTMTVSINLANMTGDWSDVRDWIMAGISTSQKTFSADLESQKYYIPNTWYLFTDKGTGSWDYPIIKSAQDFKPESEIEIDGAGEIYKIECICLVRYTLERLLISHIADNWPLTTNGTFTYPLKKNYSDTGSFELRAWHQKERGAGADTLYYDLLINLMGEIEYDGTELYKGFKRISVSSEGLSFPDELLTGWTFYKSNLDGTYGDALDYTDLQFISFIDDLVSMVGGMLYKGEGGNNFYDGDKINNCWDLIKYFCDGFLTKGIVNYNISGDVGVRFKTPLESWGSTSTLSEATSAFLAVKTLKRNEHYVNKGVAHILERNDQPDEYVEGDYIPDVSEFEYNGGAVLSEDSEEFQPILHNLIGTPLYRDTGKFITRNIYYYDSTLDVVSDYCTFNTGKSTISPDSSYNTGLPDIYSPAYYGSYKYFPPEVNHWLNARYKLSGMGYILSRAAVNLLGGYYQGNIEIETRIALVGLEDLGNEFDFDPNELISGSWLSPPMDSTAFLIKCEIDVINSIVTAKFFSHGQS